jgi:O-antigen/teichoic acid export membrane protein
MNRYAGPQRGPKNAVGPSVSGKILLGILGGTGQTVVTIIVSVVQIRLILGFLPRDISGIWFLFLSIGAYISYFDLGVSPTLSREISFITGRAGEGAVRHQEISDLIATCQRIFQILSAAVFCVGIILGGLFFTNLSGQGIPGETAAAWMIFTLGASLNLLGGAAFAGLYGTGHVATERLIRAATQLLGLALSALFLALGYGIIGLAIAWTAQNIIARLWGWKILHQYHPELKAIPGRASLALARTIAVPSLKWAAMGLGAILILQTDNPIIAARIGVSSIPSYEAAAKMVSALMTFSLLVVTSSTPFLSQAHAAGDKVSFTAILMRNVRFGMAAMLILVTFFGTFGDRILDAWLGPGNFVGFPVLWTLLVMLTLETHHVIHATASMAAGHLIFLRAAILSGIIKVCLSVYLASSFGLLGVALGTLLAQLLTNNWYAPYATLRYFHLSFTSYLLDSIVPLAALAVVMAGVNGLLRYAMPALPALLGIIVAFPVSSAIGISIVYGIMMTPGERMALLNALKRSGGNRA